MENTDSVKEVKKNKSNFFVYIIFFVIFFAIGFVVGLFGVSKFLDKEEENTGNDNPPVVQEGPEDITQNTDYNDLVSNLYGFMEKNVAFYDSKGINTSTMSNDLKLYFAYQDVIKNNLKQSDTLNFTHGATIRFCSYANATYNFVVDQAADGVVSNTCSMERINPQDLKNSYKKLFNEENIDVSVNFQPKKDKLCVIDEQGYLCGNVLDESGYTGALESRFTIQKVTKDEDGTIVIYERGYLVDNRSNVKNSNSEYENYYLHSSDSVFYYYELKSADNLTFKHTFKTNDGKNYYYVSSVVDKVEKES